MLQKIFISNKYFELSTQQELLEQQEIFLEHQSL